MKPGHVKLFRILMMMCLMVVGFMLLREVPVLAADTVVTSDTTTWAGDMVVNTYVPIGSEEEPVTIHVTEDTTLKITNNGVNIYGSVICDAGVSLTINASQGTEFRLYARTENGPALKVHDLNISGAVYVLENKYTGVSASGKITIHSGNLYVNGEGDAIEIPSNSSMSLTCASATGRSTSGYGFIGNVLLNGGNSRAEFRGAKDGMIGNVTINGGTVEARSTANGNGIRGNLIANGGKVSAYGYDKAAISDNVLLNGGTVYVSGTDTNGKAVGEEVTVGENLVYGLNNTGDYIAFDTTQINKKTLAPYVAAIGEKKYSTLEDAISASTGEQSIVLLSDVILKSYLSIPYKKTITLDLAGHTLDRWLYRTNETMCMNYQGEGYVICVYGSLILLDSSTDQSGLITGGFADKGGAIYVKSGASLLMSGGNLSGNKAYYGGGGVYIDGGTFKMTGGSISENTAKGGGTIPGGGVAICNGGSFQMDGGRIENNIATNGGGVYAVYNSPTNATPSFTMTGGVITGNHADRGSGAYLMQSEWNMSGGCIIDNFASSCGGVYIYEGTSNLSGNPCISGNVTEKQVSGTVTRKIENVYLYVSDKVTTVLHITGPMSKQEASIGVSMQNMGVFAQGSYDAQNNPDGYQLTATDLECFTSDDPTYGALINDEGEVQLERLIPVDNWSALQTAISAGGFIRISGDIVAGENDEALVVPDRKSVVIDLNGHSIDRGLYRVSDSYQDTKSNSIENGCVIKIEYATLVITDSSDSKAGKITGGNNFNQGGGVYVGSFGEFYLTAGTICDNYSKSSGGGVYVCSSGKFYMSGGKISGNIADDYGGGVYLGSSDCVCYLSNEAMICDNEEVTDTFNATKCASNLYLKQDGYITITGKMSNESIVGVYGNGEGKFATASKDYNGGELKEEELSHFSSDRDRYEIALNSEGKAELRLKAYNVTVVGGTANVNKAIEGCIVTVSANSPAEGMEFDRWTSEDVSFLDEFLPTTFFSMPARSVSVNAVFKEIPVTSVLLDQEKLELVVGESQQLSATVLPENAFDKTIDWMSSSEDVATVSENGLVTAHKAGTAKIGAFAADNMKAYCEVTVKNPFATVITAPVACTNLVYNGQALRLVSEGVAECGEMQYALGDSQKATEAFQARVPSAVNAGTYYVWYRVKADENHRDSSPVLVSEIKVAKADTVLNAPNTQMSVASNYDIISKVGLPVGWSWSTADRDKAIEYGKETVATAVYSGEDVANYKDSALSLEISISWSTCPHPAGRTQVRDAKKETCTQNGYTGNTYCLDCGALLENGQEIAAKHTRAAAVSENTIPASCEVDGSYDEVIYCAVCGEELQRVEKTITATGHKWGDWKVIIPQTETEDGLEEKVCKNDPTHKETRKITRQQSAQDDPNTKDPNAKDPDVKDPDVKDPGTKDSGADGPNTDDPGQESADPKKDSIPAKKDSILEDESAKAVYTVVSSEGEEPSVAYKAPLDASQKTVTVPADVTINGVVYKVTRIEKGAFKNNKAVETVSIGEGVTVIGDYAFAGCRSLKKIIIPSSTVKIGKFAFKGMNKLRSIIVKSRKLKDKNVSKQAFKGVGKKVTIKVPKNLKAKYRKMFRKKGLSKKVKIK